MAGLIRSATPCLKTPFSNGAFRNAFFAKSFALLQSGLYVMISCKKDKLNDIQMLFESEENHTRKSVQMQCLAKHFASCLQNECPEEFGDTFAYVKIFFGKHEGK